MKKSILFMTSFIFILSFAIQAQEKNEVIWEKIDDVTIPVPPKVHPRLYLLSSDLPELRQRMNNSQIKKTLETMKRLGKTVHPKTKPRLRQKMASAIMQKCVE